jgi:hypothetical protein
MYLTVLLTLALGNASKLFRSFPHASDFGERRRTQVSGLRGFAVGDSVLVDAEESACIASIVDANQGIVAINFADGITFGEHFSVESLTLVQAGVGCTEGEPNADMSSDESESDASAEDTDESAEDTAMVKICLFYASPSGHARTDPIINQQCASDHMHTFYGPLHMHPTTSYSDLITTPPQYSTSPVEENQSSYWHPSIYRRLRSDGEAATFELVTNLEVGPYYRWDNSVSPRTQAYPPGFQMIAHYPSTDPGAEGRMMTECCMLSEDGEEQCEEWSFLHFPARNCDFVGIALAMPSCWDGVELGNNNNHMDHMRYTTNGEVSGPCPSDFPVRLPELQLFVRILNYQGGNYKYELSNGSEGADSEGNGDNQNWHVDFFNGWKEGTVQTLIDNCPVPEQNGYNPYCECLHTNDGANALPNDITFRPRELAHQPVCEADVRKLIIDEPTHFVATLPRGTCQGPELKERSYTTLSNSLFDCDSGEPVTDGPSDPVIESSSAVVSETSTCPSGRALADADACRMAAEELGLQYKRSINRSDRPAGCYKRGNRVWYNTGLQGQQSQDRFAICCSSDNCSFGEGDEDEEDGEELAVFQSSQACETPIQDEETCGLAAETLGLELKRVISSRRRVRGCYVHKNGVYFNGNTARSQPRGGRSLICLGSQ